MLKLHTRQIDTTDTTTMKRAKKKKPAPYLQSPKNQNRRAALGRPAIKITRGEGGGLQLVCVRPTLALISALVPQTHSCLVCVEDSLLINALS